MRDLIPIREILKEIMLKIFDEKFNPECITHSNTFQDGTPSKDELIPLAHSRNRYFPQEEST
jgi:hypothetical protein